MTSKVEPTQDLEALAARLSARLEIPDPIEDAYPLSPFQEGMLFEALASDTPDLYLVQHRVRIDGPLDVDRFGQAWSHVFARHPGLRTVFLAQGHAKPLQVVCRAVPVEIETIDVTGSGDPSAAIEERCLTDRARRFELARPPLMRLMLFRCGTDHHELVTSQPHLLLDGWSNQSVFGEVFESYAALAAGSQPDLAAATPVRGFIDWVAARDPRAEEAFWRDQLAGLDTPTRMTRTDEVEGEPRSGEYVRHTRALDSDVAAALRPLARRLKVSLGAVLAGAVAVLLGRYNGRSDVVFCIVAAGRPATLPDVESIVGTLINALPLRVRVRDSDSVAEWIRDIHARQASLLAHESTPLSKIQAWSELEPGTALSDTLLSFGNFSGESVRAAELEYKSVGGFGRTGFPLSLTIEASDPMRVGVDFEPPDFSLDSANLLLDHLGRILRSMVDTPDGPVRELAMLSTTELHELTAGDRSESSVSVRDLPVHDLIAAQSARTPGATALTHGERTLSYEELDHESNRLAHHLRSRGVTSGSRVAVCLERSLDFPVTLLAVHKAGAAFVPLDPTFPAERLEYMTSDSGAGVLVSTQAILDASFGEPPGLTVALDIERDALGACPHEAPRVDVRPEDLSHVYYTSGSTGRPKGAAVEHAALTNCLTSLLRAPGMTAADRVLSVTAPTFDPVLMELFVPLMAGAGAVIATEEMLQDPEALAKGLERHGITMMFATPSRWQLLLATGWRGKPDLSVLYGGEAMSADIATRLLDGNRAVWNLYGTTETTIWSSVGAIRSGADTRTIGEPLDNTWFYVLDDELRPLPRGRAGSLFIGGVGLAREFVGKPEQTARDFIPDPFEPGTRIYRTGDLARWTESGLELLGRRDHQVKVRGHRVELGEIESVLATHPAVSVAAAHLVPHGQGDQRLVAHYVSDPRSRPSDDELREHLRARVPEYMVPQRLVRLDALPLTPSGKIDRRALPDLTESVDEPSDVPEPRTGAQVVVAQACRDLLGIDSVDLRYHFYDLGGHSLLSMRLVTLLHERSGVRIDPRTLVINTLQQVAAELARRRGSPLSDAELGSEGVDEVETPTREQADAFFFGPSDERLFGIHHAPSGPRRRRTAVLLCSPVGWEYTHTHLALRSLARRLSREGFDVLRFDYSGVGDSWGDGDQIAFARWVADVARAAAELRGRSRVGEIAVVGLRLGATVAAAACAGGLAANLLILWDPVVDGGRYLRSQESLHASVAGAQATTRPRSGALPPREDSELLGQAFPARLREELFDTDLRELAPWVAPTVVVSSTERSVDRELVARSSDTMRAVVVPDVGEWEDPQTRHAIVLPSKIPAHIVRLLTDTA